MFRNISTLPRLDDTCPLKLPVTIYTTYICEVSQLQINSTTHKIDRNKEICFGFFFSPQNVVRYTIGEKIFAVVKYVRAHCYCASLVRTLYMTWHVQRFQAHSLSRNSTKYRADDLCGNLSANIFVGCSVTLTFFSADHFLF